MYSEAKCKWCGAGLISHGMDTIFACWSIEHEGGKWTQSPKCKLKGVEDRISRVLKLLKTADRQSMPNWFAKYVDSRIVDEVVEILEGKEES